MNLKVLKSLSSSTARKALLVLPMTIAGGGEAWAQTASWNASRDLTASFATNPTTPVSPATGVWGFLENLTGVPLPANSSSYTALPTYLSPCALPVGMATPASGPNCWNNPAEPFGLPFIRISPAATVNYSNGGIGFTLEPGLLSLHPGEQSQVILSWTSPIQGKVGILSRISDVDASCGNGIRFSVTRETASGTAPSLAPVGNPMTISNGGSATFSAKANIPVVVGTRLFFIIDNNGDFRCDDSTLDVLITSK